MTDATALPDAGLPEVDTYVPESLYELLVETPAKDLPPDQGDTAARSSATRASLKLVLPDDGEDLSAHADPLHGHRQHARALAVGAAALGLKHAAALHYTEGGSRWQGIADHLVAADGHFPDYADCSSFATWCIWNGIAVPFHVADKVNGEAWRGGYTGTMVEHGHNPGGNPGKWLRADCVIYGESVRATEHTAVLVGYDRRYGSHMVISNGSEGGPYYLRWNYRPDTVAIRRYI